ncbi:hypothetical protein G6F60_000153 [Rhizopus arrhizus]|nr:hypothetical protein G6F60_000153 [Rhizopus arrhizus]
MTRSISQNTQNDLRVLKWNIQRPDNTGGRPQLLNKAIKSLMKRMIILGRLKSNVEVVGYFKAICPRLTYNTILNALKTKHGKARLDWVLAHRYWPIDNWRKVIFSKESKINFWGSNGFEFYWMWACMTSHGVGYICEIYDGRMTVSDYVLILKIELADTLDYYRLGDGDFIFQHDNDPKHTAKITTTYLKEEAKYPVLPWPSQLPDLNPIKHIWRHLKLKLALDACCKHIENILAKVQDKA